jgi:hypothetical protein
METDFCADDLKDAYELMGTFDGAALVLGINRKTFSNLWHQSVGPTPDRPKPKAPQKSKRGSLHRVAVVSDLHLGSKWQQITLLGEFLRYAKLAGAEEILCVGDICDGMKMRPGHEYEVFKQSADDILKYCARAIPKVGLPFRFIDGNHDYALFRHAGIVFGEYLAELRDDLEFLGYNTGDCIIPGGVRVRLYHGGKGCPENRSLRVQKKARAAAEELRAIGKSPPEIFLTGHCHQEVTVHNIDNMFAMGVPCFQAQTSYMKMLGLVPDIAGVMLEYRADGSGLITTPKVCYTRYMPILNDYPRS